MKGLLAASGVLLAAVCVLVVKSEEPVLLQSEWYNEKDVEEMANTQLLPAMESLGQDGESDGGPSSSSSNLSELPQVAFLSRPQDPVTPNKEGKGKKRRKGKGKKRDPCLRKYKDYCIHGECKYIKTLRAPSCICQQGYHGERCHALILPVENPSRSYDHTTILAVTAVVLSSFCLIIIAALLILRCHKKGVYDVESEEKVKLGIPVNR